MLPVCLLLSACGGGGSTNPGPGDGSTGDTEGTLSESFATVDQLVLELSTAGLWSGNGVLDSGLNPFTGKHLGGGHGVLGELIFNSGANSIDTDNQSFYSDLLGRNIEVKGSQGGVFFVQKMELPVGSTVTVEGINPLQIVTRGNVLVAGVLDCSGEDAPINFPMHRPDSERLDYSSLGSTEPSAAMKLLLADEGEAVGGEGGVGRLGAGSGGRGGASWYLHPSYFDDSKDGWYAYHSGSGPAPDPTRFTDGISGENSRFMHGENGGRIGGADALGNPLPAADALLIPDDLAAGSGMGSWAWPPKSNQIPLEADVANQTWASNDLGYGIVSYHWDFWIVDTSFRGRSRGGGGGGYWLAGGRGDFHTEGNDVTGSPLPTPDLTPDYPNAEVPENWDFNGERAFVGDASLPSDRDSWTSYLLWDNLGGGVVEDAEGGEYLPSTGPLEDFYTLDPSQDFLRGGAGGGGAGMSMHGSFNVLDEVIETYRTCDGAGGGAGGGAVQIHAGNQLSLDGQILSLGGNGGDSAAVVSSSYSIDGVVWDESLPGDAGGGGGSGGAVLLQSGGAMTFGVSAAVQLDGGRGGMGAVGNDGGEGGAGLLRLESSSALDLADMQNVVSPLAAFDLGQRLEFGLSGGNWSAFGAEFPGNMGDLTVPRTVGGGNVFFNGNSSGVASDWYELDAEVGSATLSNYSLTCTWTDGAGGGGKLVFDTSERTYPGDTPIWIAIQLDNSNVAGAAPEEWIIPGFNTIGGGEAELAANPMKRLRFQLVFDHDVIAAFIGNNPSATFRVTRVDFPWEV
jgi:hypothetical protein